MRYEYRVVPAPERGEKVKGVKGAEGRFAAAVERIMNDMAARGWEYQRSDTLPSEERAGLTATQIVWRNLLVFRRPALQASDALQPRMLEPPLVLSEPVLAAQAAAGAAVAVPEDATAEEAPARPPSGASDGTAADFPAIGETDTIAAATAPDDAGAAVEPARIVPARPVRPRRPVVQDTDDADDPEAVGLFDDIGAALVAGTPAPGAMPDEMDNGVENTGMVIGLPGALRARAERLRSSGG